MLGARLSFAIVKAPRRGNAHDRRRRIRRAADEDEEQGGEKAHGHYSNCPRHSALGPRPSAEIRSSSTGVSGSESPQYWLLIRTETPDSADEGLRRNCRMIVTTVVGLN